MHDKSVENGRLAFQIRSKMVKDEILSQSHCLVCPAWKELREGLDLKQIKDLTIYFRRLLLERAKLDVKKTKA